MAERKPWVKLARAMTTSATGVALSGVASIAATKILAITLGPSAVASLQTLQQARQTAVIAATSNGQTALVQGASSREGLERRSICSDRSVHLLTWNRGWRRSDGGQFLVECCAGCSNAVVSPRWALLFFRGWGSRLS